VSCWVVQSNIISICSYITYLKEERCHHVLLSYWFVHIYVISKCSVLFPNVERCHVLLSCWFVQIYIISVLRPTLAVVLT
jgi:hypothetical protein